MELKSTVKVKLIRRSSYLPRLARTDGRFGSLCWARSRKNVIEGIKDLVNKSNTLSELILSQRGRLLNTHEDVTYCLKATT